MADSDAGPVASPEQGQRVGRALITVALAWGTLGLAVPFGSASGSANLSVSPLEWLISGLGLIGAIGLMLDLIHPWRSYLWRTGFAEMMVGFLWSAASFYELIVPSDATLLWRFGHALMYGGYAVLALTTWRWINRGKTRGRVSG